MNKIEKLIKELCPNGVEYKELGELLSITTGKLNANAMEENGKYPFFTCNKNPYLINKYAFDTEAILISGNGSQVGHINYYKGKFNAYQRTYILSEFSEKSYVKYILYFLKKSLREYIFKNAKTGSIPYITLPMIQNFKIPLPHIKIQQQIVEILDNFTDLDTNLKQELESRKKQYEHYQSNILFNNNYDLKELSEVCKVNQGLQIPISKRVKESGKNKYFYITVQFLKNKNNSGDKYYIENPPENVICYKDDILVTRTGSTGKIITGIEGCFHNNFFKVNCFDNISKKYMYYILKSKKMYDKLLHTASGGTVPDLPHGKFYKLKIPVPTLQKQQEIVNRLDQFDKLIQEIEKEIKLRHKQYEHYREMLLNFKKLD